jgi:hypothetical protein
MSDSISVTNQCYDCMLSDSLCSECLDNQEARASDMAHQIVDDRNLQYQHVWHSTNPQPSGHDWVSPNTRVEPYFVFATQSWEDTRSEFREPASLLVDRLAQSWFLGKHIFDITVEDDELIIPKNYAICDSCHMMVNARVICPNCM